MCFDELVRFVSGVEWKEERNKNVKTLLIMFSKYGTGSLISLMKAEPHGKNCA